MPCNKGDILDIKGTCCSSARVFLMYLIVAKSPNLFLAIVGLVIYVRPAGRWPDLYWLLSNIMCQCLSHHKGRVWNGDSWIGDLDSQEEIAALTEAQRGPLMRQGGKILFSRSPRISTRLQEQPLKPHSHWMRLWWRHLAPPSETLKK